MAGGRVIASPFQFLFDGNDHLRIEGWNTAPGAVLQVQGRFITNQGLTDVFSHSLNLTADRVRAARDIPMGIGYLLNLVVTVIGATPKLGQTFTRLSVIRGLSGATIVLGVMVQGLVTSQQALAFPGSPIGTSLDGPGVDRVIQATVPAAGNPISEAVPTGALWNVLAASCRFTSDATVGNRNPYADWWPSGLQVAISVHPQVVPASTTVSLFWAVGFNVNAVTIANLTTVNLANPTLLASGAVFRIQALNIQAGDQFPFGRLQVREWLEVT